MKPANLSKGMMRKKRSLVCRARTLLNPTDAFNNERAMTAQMQVFWEACERVMESEVAMD